MQRVLAVVDPVSELTPYLDVGWRVIHITTSAERIQSPDWFVTRWIVVLQHDGVSEVRPL